VGRLRECLEGPIRCLAGKGYGWRVEYTSGGCGSAAVWQTLPTAVVWCWFDAVGWTLMQAKCAGCRKAWFGRLDRQRAAVAADLVAVWQQQLAEQAAAERRRAGRQVRGGVASAARVFFGNPGSCFAWLACGGCACVAPRGCMAASLRPGQCSHHDLYCTALPPPAPALCS
jgi:hypothetical protein